MTNREDSGSRAAKPDADPTAQQPLGRRLFQFVLVADTHVNERDGHSSSPYAANARANDRARFVFASIAQRDPQPEFVMHLGDIVHPVPELPSFEPAVRRFQSIAAVTRCPLRLLPGNHDVGDKRVEWMPAGTVTAEHVQQYRRLFGDDHYAFEHAGCRFFALNAQLINSGLPAEAEQRAWLERELAAAAGKRLFVCIHYPPYVTDRNEPGSYDNIDEPGRSWLLELIERHSVEALFAGHVHNFWYDRIGHCQMYLLPATSFLRHDYTEFYRVEPLREHGRDDTGKFGYFVVDVFERGHVAHCVRTGGRELAAGEELPPPTPGLPPVHSRTNVDAPVGVDLRHPWAELVEIAATGGVQEFERKRARNDYPLLALWEMGVRRLRVPLQDLLDPRVRDRMRILREIGHEFLVYGYGVPGSDAQRAAADTRGLVDAFEVVLPGARIAEAMPALARLREATAARVYVSKLRMHEDAKFDGLRFHHFINHGFVAAEHEQLLQLSDAARGRAAFDGFVFRVGCGDAPWDALPRCAALAAELGFGAVAHVRLAGESPADARADDRANGWRVAETLLTAFALPQIRAYFDTFMDVDRGYFPRNGFIDRRYDPRPASRIYASLHAALAGRTVVRAPDAPARGGEAAARIARADGVPLAIALPQTGSARIEVPVPRHVVIPGTVQAFDLVQGVRHAATIATERGIAHLQWPQSAAAPQGPVLVWLAGDPPA